MHVWRSSYESWLLILLYLATIYTCTLFPENMCSTSFWFFASIYATASCSYNDKCQGTWRWLVRAFFGTFGTNLTSSCRATTVDFLLNHRFFLLQEDVEKLEDRRLIVSGDVISKGVCGMGGDDWWAGFLLKIFTYSPVAFRSFLLGNEQLNMNLVTFGPPPRRYY